MKSILELPPNIPDIQLQSLLNDRIREINDALGLAYEKPVNIDDVLNLTFHRIIGVADPKDDLDAVNLRTLRKFGGSGAIQQKTVARGLDAYCIVFSKDGFVIDGEISPAYGVGTLRTGVPSEVWVTCMGAPSTSDLIINATVDGDPLLNNDLVLPQGTMAVQFSTDLAIRRVLTKGTKVVPLIVTAGGASLVSIGVEVTRQ